MMAALLAVRAQLLQPTFPGWRGNFQRALLDYGMRFRILWWSNGVTMTNPTGASKGEALRLDFDPRPMLRFRGSVITSEGGLLACREPDDVLALTTSGGEKLADTRTGTNRQHLLVG